jgi:hypothetical protein
LAAYAERYAPVAKLAGVRFPAAAAEFEVVERIPGDTTTDFGAPSQIAEDDHSSLTKARAERLTALVEAAWATFDEIAADAPPTLRKGPRGGGRDRDKIIDHVLGAESAFIRKIGVRIPAPDRGDRNAVEAMRAATAGTLRAAREPEPELTIKSWPYRYAARRIAWHNLDHAWEIEDRTER